MPILTFVDNADATHLETGGDTIYVKGDRVFVRKRHIPTGYRSAPQRRAINLMKAIAQRWKELTPGQKATWDEYYLHPLLFSNSWVAFFKNNMQNLYPDIPGKGWVSSITSPAWTVEVPPEFSAEYLWASDAIILQWKDVYPAQYYIEAFVYNVPGRMRHLRTFWKYFSWAASANQSLFVPGGKLQAGRYSLMTIRALNPRGEVSAMAEQEVEKVPDPPVVNFSGSPRQGPGPLNVQFTDLSTGIIFGYEWYFGDGGGSTDQNPMHTYEAPGQYHVALWLDGPAESITKKTKTRYIYVTEPIGEDPYVYISDSFNHRIHKRLRSDLSFVAKIGSIGTGNDQFSNPIGIAADDTHLFITECDNCRIQKRLKSDLSYVAKIGTYGTGDDQFNYPGGMCVDQTHIYIADSDNYRIVKRLKSDLSFVAKIGSEGSGNDQFDSPGAIACDDTFLYVADAYNHRIHKRLKSDLSYVQIIGTYGTGNNQFQYPLGIACDDTYVYVGDTLNHRVHKRLKSDLSYVLIFGTLGAGNNNFNRPMGIAPEPGYIFIADRYNDRMKSHRISDGAFILAVGTQGSGDNQFYQPTDAATQNEFSL